MHGKFIAILETLKFDNRWQLFIEELLGGKTLRVYRLGGVDAVADHRTGDHLGGIRGVLASNEYRCLLQRIPLDTIHTVVDLGAHVGGFVLLLKTLRVPLEHVVCVEPNPASCVKLRFNLEHNGVAAEIFKGAVSDHSGRAKIHIGKCSTGFSLIADHPDLESGSIEVETITLDGLLDRYLPEMTVDLCKMDVEGAEFEVLMSSRAETLARCRFLICEIHTSTQHSRPELIEAVERKGFVLVPVAGSVSNDTVLFRNEGTEVRPPFPALRTIAADA